MGIIDIILAGLLGYGLYKGYKNGLFVELASFVAFFLGLFITIKFSYVVAAFLEKMVSWSHKTVMVSAFLITLVLVIIAIHLSAKIVSGIASFAFLGWANKLAGALFGTIKTALLIGVLLSLFQKVNVNNFIISKETQENSLFMTSCIKTADTLLPILKEWFGDLREKAGSLKTTEESPEVAKDSVQ
jgi:membrane protein required for colicin V production